MATKKNYEDHTWMLDRLKESQEADHDNREAAREIKAFLNKRDGMWEPHWYDASKGKPRYSFDMSNPILDQVIGQMGNLDFDVKVRPQNGEATKEVAQTYDGLVRNIETVSNADKIYRRTAKGVVSCGIGGWQAIQKYVDGDSFDQDLAIDAIPDYLDRVWLGPHIEPDGSDAPYGWILAGFTKDDFKEKYPDRSESGGVSSDRQSSTYWHKHEQIMVGEFRYLLPVERTLVQMTNGKVYEEDENFKKVVDDLALLGITEHGRRKRTKLRMYSRKFDVNGWIDDKPQETVFCHWLNIIPCYANFEIDDNKLVYWGMIEKIIDPQRVLNYSMSREIEEGALAPRAKYWMTRKQAEGEEDTLATMNTNSDPVQFYTPDEQAPGPPNQEGGAQINPGLVNISNSMKEMIDYSAGMFAASRADDPGFQQSGTAIQLLQDRGDRGNNKFAESLSCSISHTGRILVDAIPRVYKAGRQIRILDSGGSYQMETIGQQVQDQQTGEIIILNDLSGGKYDVFCDVGPSMKTRQSETVNALTEIGKVDPSVIELGGDVLLKNIPAPGMDSIAERKRLQLLMAGVIPQDQQTDEEKQMLAQLQAQAGEQESTEMVLAKGEAAKGEADLIQAQTKQAQVAGDIQIRQEEVRIKAIEAETERMKVAIMAQKAGAEIEGITAKAAKDLTEAEAQDIENTAVESGITSLIERVEGAG
jgi:hypothetical protein